MSKMKTVIVTLDDEHVAKIQQVATQCKAAGMVVGESLEVLGQITGRIDPKQEPALRKVPGVISVDESQDYQLPPGDSDVQ